MAGHTHQTVVLVLLCALEVALGQDFYSTTTIKPQSSTTKACDIDDDVEYLNSKVKTLRKTRSEDSIYVSDIPDLILFYASPVITLIILILLVVCLTHSIRSCQRKFARAPTPTLPTISAVVQDGTDADPPPPYTFTDVTRDVAKSEVSVSNCPPYTKDPPTYLELTVSPQMTQS